MKKVLWSLLFLFFVFSNCAFAVEEKTTLRVGISNSSFSVYEHSSASFVVEEVASVMDMDKGSKKEVGPNGKIDVKMVNGAFYVDVNTKREMSGVKGPVVITSANKIGIKDLKRKGTPAYYKGMIELTPLASGRFNIVNVIDMQSYLKGVVPNEMPVTFGFEALKAQAVAARNYANRPNTVYPNYDVCDSTACQVYYGANSQTEISDKAVDETLGLYALYDNEIILALYSSTASGITESYYNTFGNFEEARPYLVSVKDSNVLGLVSMEDLFKNKLLSFDMDSPKYRWERTYTKAELEELLNKNLIEQSRAGFVEPKFTGDKKLSGLEDIVVLKRGDSYKALEIMIKSKSGNYVVKKELPIRRLFRQNGQFLPSANFIVEKEYMAQTQKQEPKKEEIKPETKEEPKEIKEEIKEAKETKENLEPEIKKETDEIKEAIEEEAPIFASEQRKVVLDESKKDEPKKDEIKEEEKEIEQKTAIEKIEINEQAPLQAETKTQTGPLVKLTLYGAGFGHGVGMSQYGAGFLSNYGVSYDKILKHYYTGIKLGTVPKTVEYNNLEIDYVQEFYFTKHKPRGDFQNPAKTDLKEEIETLLAKNKRNKCFLTIENEDRVANVEFYINGYHFSPDFRGYKKKVFTSEITNYLREGVNKITFNPLDESDKRKTLRFYITMGEGDDDE